MEEKNSLRGEGESTASDRIEKYEPKSKYESVLYRVYSDVGLTKILKVASAAIAALTALAFFVHLLELFLEDPLLPIEELIITGAPFVILSVVRRLINAPRPYEIFEFYEKKPRCKAGRSFPSRHVFSVFVIAAVILPSSLFLGITLLLLGTALALFRVLLGIHFIRDVAAGALIGIISGALGLLTLYLI